MDNFAGFVMAVFLLAAILSLFPGVTDRDSRHYRGRTKKF